GTETVTTPYPVSENAVNPIVQILAYGAGYVAQGSTSDLKGLAKLIVEAMRYPGFSFINVKSPCVTYGTDENMTKGLKERMVKLEDEGHDPSDKIAAYRIAETDSNEKLYVGVVYRNDDMGMTFNELHEERVKLAQAAGTYERNNIFLDNFAV
ncbi:hypothetical protein KAI87_01260, partial [Myxococcota bacterium]|nr:hypothetical protein [Myxococcota bacterium]